jgi:hypothetical protein
VGKVVQPLQNVNYHDSRIHGHERHGPFTRLVRVGWVGSAVFQSSQSCSWYVAGVKPVCMVWLEVGCLLALVGFGYKCESCELEALDYRG